MRISDWSSDVFSSDLPGRAEQPLLLGGGRHEIDVAVGPRAARKAFRDLDQHRDAARIVDRTVADAVGVALLAADAEMIPMAEEQHRLAVGPGAGQLRDEDRRSTRLNSSH